MSVLSKKSIQERLLRKVTAQGSIVITPLLDAEAMFDSDSVDLRLGEHFLLPRTLQEPFYCPDEKSKSILHVRAHVPFGEFLVVPAHQTVLGSTLEFIKLPNDVAGEVLTKSSIARTFIVVETAPWIHPEYRGCLTLEIANVSNTPVLLYPGRPIAQLVFFKLDEPIERSQNEKLSRTYFGPIYPEPANFRDPSVDLQKIGVQRTARIVRDTGP